LLQDALAAPTDYRLPIVGRSAGHRIELRLARRLARLGPEGYELDVSVRRIAIRASAAAGAFCAIQTLLQMMPPEILRRAPVGNVRWRVPCIAIEDAPRFSWRGLLIDVARHFLPKEFIFKMLDLMALYKLNVLQLHLTDDHGWRIEIKRYPRLTEIGARSDYSAIEPPYEATRSRSQRPGGFYTQDDIREMVGYAADRCITVVPEIEMPGHAGAAILAYPELGKDRVFNVEESTIRMLKNVLDEVLELFPSKFIHIGGDEVSKLPWKSDPRARQRMRAAGLRNEEELQSWFIKQFDSYLTAKGRRLVGWDEILEGGLAPGATVMSWRGVAGVAAAKAGHDVVMAPTDKTYFDTYQSRLQALEPQAIANYLPLEEVYTFEPIAPALSADEGKRVLGAQASLWGEYISQSKHAEYMAFPRLLAFAETVWSTPRSRDWDSFISRLDVQFKKLDARRQLPSVPARARPAPVLGAGRSRSALARARVGHQRRDQERGPLQGGVRGRARRGLAGGAMDRAHRERPADPENRERATPVRRERRQGLRADGGADAQGRLYVARTRACAAWQGGKRAHLRVAGAHGSLALTRTASIRDDRPARMRRCVRSLQSPWLWQHSKSASEPRHRRSDDASSAITCPG
jgi:hexosaminidase